MFAEMEIGLVAVIEASPLAQKLVCVETLPELDGDNLVKQFAARSPAVYVVAGVHAPVSDGAIRVPFGLACVARNARGHESARRGDGKTIGMYQILSAVLGLLDNGRAGSYVWRVTGADLMTDDKLSAAGLTCAVVRVETLAALPNGIDDAALAALSEFTTLRADYDIAPHDSAAEHAKWAGDVPDYSISKPDLQDQQPVQP